VKVAKFGGSSVADAEQIRKVCAIITSDPERRLVVVSAPGRRHPNDTKVTDLLIACAEARLAGVSGQEELDAIIGRYGDIADAMGFEPAVMEGVEADLRERLGGPSDNHDRFLDTMKAAGEDNAARLLAACLRAAGAEARYVSPRDAGLVLTQEHGNARVLPESYANLARLAQAEGISVFPGFFGYSAEGAVVTLPRGGSDITGSILAAAVKADVYENFTDVDSVFVTDPAVVPEVRPLQELTYREMRELSYAGFGVFHEEALEAVFRAGVPVCIKNTNNPTAPGTRIVHERSCPIGAVSGIAAGKGFCQIYVSKYLMNREVGFGRRLLQILEDEGMSYEHTPSGIDNISVVLREGEFTESVEAKVVRRIRDELEVDDVNVERGLALVMIVGERMHRAVGTAARACQAFAEAHVNLEMINQGASEVSMMFGVKADDADTAVRALYDAFFPRAAS